MKTLPSSSSPEGPRAVQNSRIARLWGRGGEGRKTPRGGGTMQAVEAGCCGQVRLRVGVCRQELRLRHRHRHRLGSRLSHCVGVARPGNCGKESLSPGLL